MGTTQYHLSWLEKTGKITSSRRGLFKYYFPSGTFRDNEKSLLEVLSHETARQVLILIIEGTNPSQSDIAEKIGMSGPSVNWHVRRLVQSGVIDEFRDGKYKRYHLRGDPQQLVSLMKTYYPSLWDTWSDRLAEIFLSLSKGDQKP
jgi:predicted transcriptional regulator